MTNILAFDTSGNACSVALLLDNGGCDEQVIELHQVAPKQQAAMILPAIQQLLTSHSLTFAQLNGVAYGAGPGSFTGLRLASSVAQAIGYTANIPIITISSLAALAQSAYQENGWERVLVAADARQNQFYWAPYRLGQSDLMELACDEEKLIAADAANFEPFDGWYGVGDAWDVYKEKIGVVPVAVSAMTAPFAKAILALALPKFEKRDWISASDALPVYLNPYKR